MLLYQRRKEWHGQCLRFRKRIGYLEIYRSGCSQHHRERARKIIVLHFVDEHTVNLRQPQCFCLRSIDNEFSHAVSPYAAMVISPDSPSVIDCPKLFMM